MTAEVELRRSDLAGPGAEFLDPSGVFYFHASPVTLADRIYEVSGAIYNVEFRDKHGLAAFWDFFMVEGSSGTVARLGLAAPRAGDRNPVAKLRFQFNREHQVAAAVVVAADRDGVGYSWMTRGDAGCDDVVLAHDSWNPDDTLMPAESFITVAELREVVFQWVFGDVLPPPAVRWVAVPDVGWL